MALPRTFQKSSLTAPFLLVIFGLLLGVDMEGRFPRPLFSDLAFWSPLYSNEIEMGFSYTLHPKALDSLEAQAEAVVT